MCRISKHDKQPFVMDSDTDFPRVSLTPIRHWSENAVDGCGSCCSACAARAAAAECPGVIRQRNVRNAILPSIYGSVSHATGSFIEPPLNDIGTAAAAVEPSIASLIDSGSYKSSPTSAVPGRKTLMVGPGRFATAKSRALHVPSSSVVRLSASPLVG